MGLGQGYGADAAAVVAFRPLGVAGREAGEALAVVGEAVVELLGQGFVVHSDE